MNLQIGQEVAISSSISHIGIAKVKRISKTLVILDNDMRFCKESTVDDVLYGYGRDSMYRLKLITKESMALEAKRLERLKEQRVRRDLVNRFRRAVKALEYDGMGNVSTPDLHNLVTTMEDVINGK